MLSDSDRDRDGTACAPEFTAFVRDVLSGFDYDVECNEPFKGAELVRIYADSAAGRHSLQIEINKRLHMDPVSLPKKWRLANFLDPLGGGSASAGLGAPTKHAGFNTPQGHLMQILDANDDRFNPKS